jgi:hypothetical protein
MYGLRRHLQVGVARNLSTMQTMLLCTTQEALEKHCTYWIRGLNYVLEQYTRTFGYKGVVDCVGN